MQGFLFQLLIYFHAMRKNILLLTIAVITICLNVSAQKKIPGEYPIKALSIGPPTPANLDSFIVFVNNELAPRGVNTIFLLVDYNYQFKSHPELAADDA